MIAAVTVLSITLIDSEPATVTLSPPAPPRVSVDRGRFLGVDLDVAIRLDGRVVDLGGHLVGDVVGADRRADGACPELEMATPPVRRVDGRVVARAQILTEPPALVVRRVEPLETIASMVL